MQKKKPILLVIFILIFACNIPPTGASPHSQSSGTQTASAQQPDWKATLDESKPAATLQRVIRSTPTEKATSEMDSANVDDFFARCPIRAEIESLLADISINFNTDPTAGTQACKASEGSLDLSPLQKRAYQSVLIMKQLTFDSPLPWTEKNLYEWFSGTIDAIRFRADIPTSYCCEPANVINIQVAENSYIFLTDRWIDPAIGGGLRDTMVLYVHEARHNEGYGHTCGSDDNTIAEMGSWGVQYYLLQWLAQHSDPAFFQAPGDDPDLYQRMALSEMVAIRKSRFCNEPTITPGDAPTLAG